jgi:hypothetical protein
MANEGHFQESENTAMVFNAKRVVHETYALSDSEASLHSIIKSLPAFSIKLTEYPITNKLPNGSIIWLAHTRNLNITGLPYEMTEAHIVPGL